MDTFNQFIINTIIILSAISTIVLLLEALGFLPHKISKHLIKNKLGLTREVLKDLGIPVKEFQKKISTCLTSKHEKDIEAKLKNFTYNIEVEIGETRRGYTFPHYIDLMGATTSETYSRDFAGILNSFMDVYPDINLSEIDVIVTSKLGSPILGYEFSKNIQKPFMLHSSEVKFRPKTSKKHKLQQKFDTGETKNYKNKKALIIDDSTTGGRKIANIIDDLRDNNIIIEHCLVIFAPQGKRAYDKLKEKDVKLHTIIKTHEE